jgi:4-diphosphocytidyl-2-C-methyl-D-erythritol kinase
LADVGKRLHNGLQAAARTLADAIGRLETEFAKLNLLGHAMSGSGSSYFGLCRSRRQAGRIATLLRSRGLGRAYAVSSVAGPESFRMSA